MSQPNLPRVIYKKLGRYKCIGRWTPGKLFIDPRTEDDERLGTIIHEAIHEFIPMLSEEATEAVAENIAQILWAERYRQLPKI